MIKSDTYTANIRSALGPRTVVQQKVVIKVLEARRVKPRSLSPAT